GLGGSLMSPRHPSCPLCLPCAEWSLWRGPVACPPGCGGCFGLLFLGGALCSARASAGFLGGGRGRKGGAGGPRDRTSAPGGTARVWPLHARIVAGDVRIAS